MPHTLATTIPGIYLLDGQTVLLSCLYFFICLSNPAELFYFLARVGFSKEAGDHDRKGLSVSRRDYICQLNQTPRWQETLFIICYCGCFNQLSCVRLLLTCERHTARDINIHQIFVEQNSLIRRFLLFQLPLDFQMWMREMSYLRIIIGACLSLI